MKTDEMNIAELIKANRLEEMKAICRFIDHADFEELGAILEEIRCCHDNLYAFCPNRKFMAKIESISLNGERLQLNIEKEEECK